MKEQDIGVFGHSGACDDTVAVSGLVYTTVVTSDDGLPVDFFDKLPNDRGYNWEKAEKVNAGTYNIEVTATDPCSTSYLS